MRKLISVMALSILTVVFVTTTALSSVVFVKTTGNNLNNGLSWSLAKKTVQAGLDAATDGDEVWVAFGKYYERITISHSVSLYGGFAGTETTIDSRDLKLNVTTLDGSRKASVIKVLSGPGSTAIVDGITITNGLAANGGGVYSIDCTLTLSNNTITKNTATLSGGGVYTDGDSYSVYFATNKITSNTAASGGGISCNGGQASDFIGNTVTSNKALTGSGGGLMVSTQGFSIVDSTIRLNTAAVSGGGMLSSVDTDVANSVIADNTAGIGGGAYCSGYADFTNDAIAGNKALGYLDASLGPIAPDGGGVYFAPGAVFSLQMCAMAFNTSGAFAGDGVTSTVGGNCLYANTAYNYANLPPTTGDILADPVFVYRSGGNYHIKGPSPCIDASPDGVSTGEIDIDGQPRVYGARMDIGPDEWQPYLPVNVSFSPNNAVLAQGIKLVITSKYSIADGAAALSNCYLLLNTSFSEAQGMELRYDATTNLLYVRNDAGNSWGNGHAPGSGWTMRNARFILYTSGSSISRSGDSLTIKWNVVFRPAACGMVCSAWLQSASRYGPLAPWEQKGSVAISPTPTSLEPVNVSLTPHSGNLPVATKIQFTTMYSDPDGYADLAGGHLLLSADGLLPNSLYLKYDFVTGKMYLKNDASTSWSGGYLSGAPNTISNKFCTLYCAETTMTASGNTISVTWTVMIKSAKAKLNVGAWMLTWDRGGLYDDWQDMGDFYILPVGGNQPPSIVSLSPNSGSIIAGDETILTSAYSDSNSNITNSYLLLNTDLSEAGAADFRYDATMNRLYVRNDAGTSWLGGKSPGSNSVIENTLCRLNCAHTTVSVNGTTTTIGWAVTLKPVASGSDYTAWMQVLDAAGDLVPWRSMGAFGVQ